MIDVFYTPGKGIYLSDEFCPDKLRQEFDETGQVTVLFRGLNGPVETSYPTDSVSSKGACQNVANLIVRKLSYYFREVPVRVGTITQNSTEIMNNGKTGVIRLVFQMVHA